METAVYQSIRSIFHKSLDLLITSILNNNNNNNNIWLMFPSFGFESGSRIEDEGLYCVTPNLTGKDGNINLVR